MPRKAYKQAKETKETTERIEEKADKILRFLVKENEFLFAVFF